MARLLQSISLAGPAGPLEALLEEPEQPTRLRQVAALCHPHPQFGGTMHNKVVYRLARAARQEGAATLRFNYRGVGASAGTYDGGRGEQDDLRAALRYLSDRYPGLPVTVGGFSFGATVSLRVSCGESRIAAVVAVGTPVGRGDWTFLRHCACPKRFIHSTRDEFGSRADFDRVYADALSPKQIAWIEARDHFFADALDQLEAAARAAFG